MRPNYHWSLALTVGLSCIILNIGCERMSPSPPPSVYHVHVARSGWDMPEAWQKQVDEARSQSSLSAPIDLPAPARVIVHFTDGSTYELPQVTSLAFDFGWNRDDKEISRLSAVSWELLMTPSEMRQWMRERLAEHPDASSGRKGQTFPWLETGFQARGIMVTKRIRDQGIVGSYEAICKSETGPEFKWWPAMIIDRVHDRHMDTYAKPPSPGSWQRDILDPE